MTEQQEKALKLLGLARRARKLEIGEEPCGIACRGGKARLLLVARDAAEHTIRRAQSFCRSGKPLWITVPYTKEELGNGLGCNACALCALTDAPFAKAFLEALHEPDAYQAAMEEMTRQSARVTRRRQEEKAHRKNVRFGKK